MPNHVENILYVIAPNKDLEKEILDLLKGKEEDSGKDVAIDFNSITPTPPWISTGNLGMDERDIWGDRNWYDWNLNNWGTKWNAYEQELTFKTVNSEKVPVIIFQTAWAPPIQVLSNLPYIFPYAAFLHVWADEDHGSNVGMALYGFVNNQDKVIEWYDRTNMGESIASSAWGMGIDDVYEYAEDTDSEDDVVSRVLAYSSLNADLFINQKLREAIENKFLFLPVKLREKFDFTDWKEVEKAGKERVENFTLEWRG